MRDCQGTNFSLCTIASQVSLKYLREVYQIKCQVIAGFISLCVKVEMGNWLIFFLSYKLYCQHPPIFTILKEIKATLPMGI